MGEVSDYEDTSHLLLSSGLQTCESESIPYSPPSLHPLPPPTPPPRTP